MARRAFYCNPITYYSQTGSPFTNIAGSSPKLNYSESESGVACRSNSPSAAGVFTGSKRFGQTDGSNVSLTKIGFTIRFRVRNTPTGQSSLFSLSNSGGVIVVSCYINTNHTLTFYNSTGTTNAIVTSQAILFGENRTDWTTVQLLATTASDFDGSGITIIVNGITIFVSSVGNPIPGPGAGLNSATNILDFIANFGASPNVGLDTDFDQVIVDDAAIQEPSNFTIVPIIDNGFYQNFVGGNPAWEYRNFHRRLSVGNSVTTTSASIRESYKLANLRDYGITGNILSATIFGLSQYGGASQSGTFFFRKSGVNTDAGSTFLDSFNPGPHKTFFNNPGWTPDDEIEIGILNGVGTATFTLWYIGCLVEHDTPVTFPDLQTVRAEIINYTGTGALQTITLPFVPTWIHILPRTAVNNGSWWWNPLFGIQTLPSSDSLTLNVGINGDKLELGANTAAFNSAAVIYDVLCIEDRQGRVFDSGTFRQIDQLSPIDTQNYQVKTAMESPEGVFITYVGVTGGGFTGHYKDNNVPGNSAIRLAAAALDTDRILEMNATGFVVRKGLYVINTLHYPYFAVKPGGFLQNKLIAIQNYVGNGGVSQVVPIDMNGGTIRWAYILPHNGGTRHYRNALMTPTGATILAFGLDSLTVGSDPNQSGVTYTIVAFAEGEDAPDLGNQYSGIYAVNPELQHDSIWDRVSGPTALLDVKIPNPRVRFAPVGSRDV